MGQFGLIGISLPSEYGGSGFDTVDYSAVVMELAKLDGPVLIIMVSHTSFETSPLFLFRREKLKKKYLPKIASAEAFLALGLSEPPVSSDKESMETAAIKQVKNILLLLTYLSEHY